MRTLPAVTGQSLVPAGPSFRWSWRRGLTHQEGLRGGATTVNKFVSATSWHGPDSGVFYKRTDTAADACAKRLIFMAQVRAPRNGAGFARWDLQGNRPQAGVWSSARPASNNQKGTAMTSRLLGATCAAALACASFSVTAAPITKNYSLAAAFGQLTFSLTAEPTTAALGLAQLSAFSLTTVSQLPAPFDIALNFGLGDVIFFDASSWADGFALESLRFGTAGKFSTGNTTIASNRFVSLNDPNSSQQNFFLVGEVIVGSRDFVGDFVTLKDGPLNLRPLPDTTVPEPATLTLLGIGLLGLARQAKRRKA